LADEVKALGEGKGGALVFVDLPGFVLKVVRFAAEGSNL